MSRPSSGSHVSFHGIGHRQRTTMVTGWYRFFSRYWTQPCTTLLTGSHWASVFTTLVTDWHYVYVFTTLVTGWHCVSVFTTLVTGWHCVSVFTTLVTGWHCVSVFTTLVTGCERRQLHSVRRVSSSLIRVLNLSSTYLVVINFIQGFLSLAIFTW